MVEDDERIRTAVRLALENEGWEVVEARSGEEALQVFPEADADIVLIDIMLPGIDGFEVCRTVRRQSDIPVVMVTARDDTHDVVAGLEAGADDYLTKPFAPASTTPAFFRTGRSSGVPARDRRASPTMCVRSGTKSGVSGPAAAEAVSLITVRMVPSTGRSRAA